jgi:hypothetical protein
MARIFVCPICEDRNALFSGVKASLVMRSTFEWAAIFVCGNSHIFSLLLADVAPSVGLHDLKVAKFADLEKTLRRVKKRRPRFGQPDNALQEMDEEPPDWQRLQELAKNETDPGRLQVLADWMVALLQEREQAQRAPEKSILELFPPPQQPAP